MLRNQDPGEMRQSHHVSSHSSFRGWDENTRTRWESPRAQMATCASIQFTHEPFTKLPDGSLDQLFWLVGLVICLGHLFGSFVLVICFGHLFGSFVWSLFCRFGVFLFCLVIFGHFWSCFVSGGSGSGLLVSDTIGPHGLCMRDASHQRTRTKKTKTS